METFIGLLLSGLALGCVYAIVAMGFGLIFNTARFFDLGFGGIYVWAAYLVWLFAIPSGLPLWLSIILSLACAALIGVVYQLTLLRFLRRRGATPLVSLLATLGVMIALQNIPPFFWAFEPRRARIGMATSVQIGPVGLSDVKVAGIVAAILIFIGLWFFLNRTRSGTAMRAVAGNPEMAKVIGINPDRILVITYAIGCSVGAVGAILTCLDLGATPLIGFDAVLIACIAVIVGGIGSFKGAALGGLLLGLIRCLAGIWVTTALWSEFFLFAILFLLIAFRPRGIFGKKVWKAEV